MNKRINCKWCGQEFTKVNYRMVYCHDGCRKKASDKAKCIRKRKPFAEHFKEVTGKELNV